MSKRVDCLGSVRNVIDDLFGVQVCTTAARLWKPSYVLGLACQTGFDRIGLCGGTTDACRAPERGDAALRGHARDALVGMDSAAVAALIDSLKAEDTGLRQRAADILRWIGESAKEAVPALTQALEDPDYRVRRRAERASGEDRAGGTCRAEGGEPVWPSGRRRPGR